jgi:hypothetical protein
VTQGANLSKLNSLKKRGEQTRGGWMLQACEIGIISDAGKPLIKKLLCN